MLTRQGILTLLGALAVGVLAWLFGVPELVIVAVAILALLVASGVRTAAVRMRLEVARNLHPPRVHLGTPARIELRVHNVGTTTTPVLRLRDPVQGTRGAELLLAPLRPGDHAQATYVLPTRRRGIVGVGPLDVVVADPYGFVSVRSQAAPITELTVYPRVDELVPLPHSTSQDPHAGSDHPNAMSRGGEDFYALRPYVKGDDLRRVHWRSTAHHDELMVRQEELPWQSRVTVILDLRRNTQTSASLELAVSAAASIVLASWKRRSLVRLATTDGHDSGFASGHAHMEALMEHLAVVERSSSGSLRRVLDLVSRSGGGDLVLVVAELPEPELSAVARLRGRFGSFTLVRFHRSSYEPSVPAPAPAALNPALVEATSERPFATAWNDVVARRNRRAVAG